MRRRNLPRARLINGIWVVRIDGFEKSDKDLCKAWRRLLCAAGYLKVVML